MFEAFGQRKRYTIPAVAAVGVLSVALAGTLSLGDNLVTLGLFFVFITVLIGVAFYTNRKLTLAIYLLTIVNLDYLRLLSEPFNLTVDILFSIVIMLLTVPLFLGRKISWRKSPIQKAFIFYLLITLLCVVLSVEPLISLKRWLRYVNYFVLFTLIVDVARDRATIQKFTRVIIYASIIPCVVGFYGLIARTPGLIGENLRFIYSIDMVRIKSTLSHANTFGLFLSLSIPTTIGLLLQRKGWGLAVKNHQLIMVLFLTLPMLYFTYSRIGWIITCMIIIMILLLQKRWSLLTIIPWLFGLIIWRIPGLLTRWSDIIDPSRPDSLEWRRGLYAFSLNKFLQKPLLGAGPGTFLEYVAFGKGYAQHHLWIGSLVEVGILGTAALFILLMVVLAQLIRYFRRKPTTLNTIVLSIFFVLIVISLVSDPFSVPSVVLYLWALIGLAEAEFQIQLHKEQQPV